MTPGFAKTRAELPWLPYGEVDRVIINSHNFTPAGPDFSVNGKSPIAVWCPSKDDTGNLTTTLNDLVGPVDGTLTSMDAATDWVADTGAGGVRALDFDGTNDRVDFGNNLSFERTQAFSVSMWVNFTKATADVPLLTKLQNAPPFRGWAIEGSSGRVRLYLISTFGSSYIQKESTATVNNGAWRHIVVTYSGSSAASGVNFYVDGSLSNGSTVANNLTATTISSVALQMFARDSQLNSPGRCDDARVFDQVLSLADVGHLYASGAGRGISA